MEGKTLEKRLRLPSCSMPRCKRKRCFCDEIVVTYLWRFQKNSPTLLMNKKISSALISVFYKDGLEPVVKQLEAQGATIYTTGGTQKFIEDLNIKVVPVESL